MNSLLIFKALLAILSTNILILESMRGDIVAELVLRGDRVINEQLAAEIKKIEERNGGS